jgi:CheY-like chemotaxis protein
MSAISVLCVENHSEYMGALKYMLERSGYEVTPATTGVRLTYGSIPMRSTRRQLA